MRLLCIVFPLALCGCLGADPCADVSADACVTLDGWPPGESSYVVGETTTLTIDFVEAGVDRPRTLRLMCEVESDLTGCTKSWTMPDLDRLPHAEARLLGADEPVESLEGKFRVDDVVLLNDEDSYRVTGSVDRLRFDTEGESLVFADGAFDVAARELK